MAQDRRFSVFSNILPLVIVCAFLAIINAQGKTVFINIGFACSKQCGREIVGTQNDQKFYDELAGAIAADKVIHVDDSFFEKFENKQKFLDFIKGQTSEFDTVVFSYSGHGAPTPKTANFSKQKLSTEEFEFLFGNKKFISCMAEVKGRIIDSCNKSCKNSSFEKFKCPPEYDTCETDCFKILEDFPNYLKCMDKCEAIPSFKTCDKARLISMPPCTNDCDRLHNSREPYKVFQNRFSEEYKDCYDRFSLVSSDFEKLFKDQKLIGLVDACYSGLFKNFRHKDFMVAASSNEFQVSEEDLEIKQGRFTTGKKTQFEKLCQNNGKASKSFVEYIGENPGWNNQRQNPLVINRLSNSEVAVNFDSSKLSRCDDSLKPSKKAERLVK